MNLLQILIIAVVVFIVFGMWCMCRIQAVADKKLRDVSKRINQVCSIWFNYKKIRGVYIDKKRWWYITDVVKVFECKNECEALNIVQYAMVYDYAKMELREPEETDTTHTEKYTHVIDDNGLYNVCFRMFGAECANNFLKEIEK